jgi:glycosyltransferase involved in cell wall biosynthesis
MMIRVLLLIRCLEIGGAERQVIYLAKGLDKSRFAVTLATFYDGGALRAQVEAAEGVRVVSLQKRGRWDLLGPARRLGQLVREVQPHIVHGYMLGANELGLVAGRLGGARVIWGLRASNMDMGRYDWFAASLFRLGGCLSRCADLLIVNSHAGRQYHLEHGYAPGKMVVIPNGIDIDRFQRDVPAGRRLREQWGVAETDLLVGIVGRIDPMKDHATFLHCAALLARRPEIRFVCVGDGPAALKSRLQELSRELGLDGRIFWAGPTSSPTSAYSALDVLISSSAFGEGTSNVIGEAMACAVPCAVTDVGDSARLVGETGAIAPPCEPALLAHATEHLLALSPERRSEIGRAARQRVLEEFTIPRMVQRTEDALCSVLPAGEQSGMSRVLSLAGVSRASLRSSCRS